MPRIISAAMTTMKKRRTLRREAVERLHPLLELDRAELLGGPLGRLAIEQGLDDAVHEDAGEPGDEERDDDRQQDRDDLLLERGDELGERRLGEVHG